MKEQEKNKLNFIKIITIKSLYIISLIILIINIIFIFQMVRKPNEIPEILGMKSYIVTFDEMKPAIKYGDVAITKKANIENLKAGDIISIRKNQDIIIRRIERFTIDENNQMAIVVKGDNNNSEDGGKVLKENITGKLIGRIPKIGKIALYTGNKVVIVVLSIICYWLYKTNKKMENTKKKRYKKRIRDEFERKLSEV